MSRAGSPSGSEGAVAGAALGLGARIRSLAVTVLDLAHTRALLLGTDVELQLQRLRSLALLGIGAFLLLGMALLFATLLVVAAFWDTHRLAALAGVAIVYLAAGLGCLQGARRLVSRGPRLFEATLEELRRDVARLRG